MVSPVRYADKEEEQEVTGKLVDLHAVVNDVRKEFGETSLFILGENKRLMNIEVRPSGSLMLDLALGGGYPKGRILEFSGREKSGKTTLASLAIAEAQVNEPDKANAIIDSEFSFNPAWAKTLGVDVDKLLISQPDTYAEKVFDLIEFMLQSGKYAYIVLDSIAGLVPKDEFENDDWDKESRIGGNSKNNAKAMRKLVNSGLLAKSGTTLIFINQLRDLIGGFSPHGTPTTTTGGRSIRHAYTQQLEVSTGELFSKGTGASKEYFGQQIRVKVAKNKIAPPFGTATLDLYYAYGIDKVKELVNVAKEINVLQGTSWIKFANPLTGEVYLDGEGKEIKFQGVAKAVEALNADIQTNNGQLYLQLFDVVQKVLRGEVA